MQVQNAPAMKKSGRSGKSGRRYAKGERSGKPNVSGKWARGARRRKSFVVESEVLVVVGARYSVVCTGPNSFKIEKRLGGGR